MSHVVRGASEVRLSLLLLLPLGLLGCGGVRSDIHGLDPADSGAADTADLDAGDSATDTAPYVAEEDPVQPSLSLDEVSAAVTEALEAVHRVDPAAMFDAYDDAMAPRSSGCPYTDDDYEAYGVDYWYDNCTADSGSHYAGYGYGYHNTDWWSGQYFYRHNGYWFGDAKIEAADGSALVTSGSAYFYDYDETTYGGTGYYFNLIGEFSSTSPAWAGSWLEDDVSVSLTVSQYHYGADPGSLELIGGVSHMDGTANAVEFDHLYMLSTASGSECSSEPGGTVSVRDAEGEWYDVTFQGPVSGSSTAFPAECDGCGEVWFRGAPIGDVCPDLSTLQTWGI